MMLDTQTKSKIDSARDILVGKVPDPKSQVEQITIALIYKFMDDMDRQSEELGGKVTFFTGEFKKYRWANLLDKRLGGHERLGLYSEGLDKMNTNKNIPQLFRDIFKGVFLPYRDPETLNLFLKEIGSFNYDHSERLGDAYEYLLNILGTQGDAGQFRTPRHIIDFIVAVVDPQKNETVLDPACGTAGFLISAFKHILRNNENLTPDERARMMTNFRGYDIAPDMVRLSRVNMYLHSFPNPVIHEYDTLTSEERWDERCDVILANPPFMTPKGGIRPHNRFSIKAKRSEVLFVDYMAEHLNPGGRAGIIVPEGIIFQSQNAYKALRKMLVENYLWAVVSLPAGVFNPYSGVKTSILFLDRNLARRTDELLFVKVESDGFDLGAQRRPIEGSQLPEALRILDTHKKAPTFAKASAGRQEAQESKMALTVSRKRLLESGDISLSGDRYRKAAAVQSKWPMVKLGEVVEINRKSCDPKTLYENSTFVYLDISAVENGSGKVSFESRLRGVEAPSRARRMVRQGDILLSTVRPNLQAFAYLESVPSDAVASTGFAVLTPYPEKADGSFLYAMCFSIPVMKQMIGRMGKGAYPSITQSDVEEITIPLPPLEIQRQMVAELDGYRKLIEGARQVIANYKPTIKIDPGWSVVKLGDVIVGKPKNGYSGKPVDYPTPTKVLSLSATTSGRLDPAKFKYLDEEMDENSPARCKRGDILLQRGNTIELVGTAALFDIDDRDYIYPDLMIRVRADETVLLCEYLVVALQSPEARTFIKNHASGSAGSMPKINQAIVESVPIPLPPLDIQRRIVAELEAERALVEANRKLIDIFEKKIQAKLTEIWGGNELAPEGTKDT
jgi:type I restriction enzyme M protein